MRLNMSWNVAAFAACFSVASVAGAQAAKTTAAPAAGGAGGATAAPAAPATAGAPAAAAPTTAAPATGTTATPPAATGTTATPPAAAAPAATTPAATTPAPTGAATPAAPAAGGAIDGSTYVVRLRDLEQRIDELKEQIRRSHTRLSLLSDTILSGGVGGARAEISFRNDISSAFRLTGAVFVLDGVVQYNKQDDSEAGLLASQKEIPVFSGAIPPGDHTLQVVVHLQGYGYGVFSYLRSYKFDVKASHSFTITEGKTIGLEVIAWEKGDVTTPIEQRPDVRFTEKLRTGMSEATPAAGSPSPAAPAVPAQGSASGNISVGAGGK